jgi:ketosteroid isomerase-like protein
MKKLILLGLTIILFASCKQTEQRYFSESTEISDFKTSIDEYSNGNWEAWRTHFADTAKLYINSTKSSTVADLETAQKQLLSNFSSYGFLDKDSFVEMVLDSKDETWVYYWATWQGTLKANGKVIDVPVHIASNYKNGKVVQLVDYWDSAPITTALQELEAAQMTEEETEVSKK